jgi:hypothetical protein
MGTQQYDVLSSAIFTASGLIKTCDTAANIGRQRIKAIYYAASANGTLTFREGSVSGQIRLTFATTSSASGLVLIPGEGILFNDTPYVVITGTITGATVLYG